MWRYSDARVVEVDFNRPDALGKPNGAAIKALDIAPHAGAKEFDDSSWEQIGATTLEDRRSNARLAFSWHRLNVRIPEQVGGFDTSGSTVVFEVTVDDYAEVWVDGELPRELGQSGGSLVAGWNAPNGVVVTRGARPGQRVQLAIFGANGPPSDPPPNYIWIRSARLLFYPGEPRATSRFVPTELDRIDPALDAIVQPEARIEQIAEGFQFTEGPVWVDGSLLFSDPNDEDRRAWQPLRFWTGRRLDHLRGRKASRHDRRAGTAREHGMGRRRSPHALPDGSHRLVSDTTERTRRRDGVASRADHGPLSAVSSSS